MKTYLIIAAFLCLLYSASAQPNNGLIAHYSFNHANAMDDAGTNHGTINGATLTTDRFGNPNSAFRFDQNQTITVPDVDTLDGMVSELSISFWVKASPLTGGNHNNLISKFSHCIGVGDDAYNIRLNDLGQIQLQIDDTSGIDKFETSSLNIADNAWHFVVFVWQRPNCMIYIDGVADAAGFYNPFNYNLGNSSEVLAFGEPITAVFCGVTWQYGESLDDIRIYSRALELSEITDLFHEPYSFETSVQESNTPLHQINVFPNPSKGLVHFSEFVTVRLENIFGQSLATFKQINTLDLAARSSGIYIAAILNEKGEIVQRIKILKE